MAHKSKNYKRHEAVFNMEEHPFGDFVYTGVKYLVIGTFPTHKDNLRYKFFYSGKKNHFWDVFEDVFNYAFKFHSGDEAVDERKKILKNYGIGITDMHKICYRKNKCATDENLVSIVLTDIFSLLKKYSTIERLILTSRTKVFGALGLLETYFIQQKTEFPEIIKNPNKIKEGKFKFDNRNIKMFVPYSPSQRLIENNITTKKELVDMYKKCLI